jgi:hypothetical protein
MARTMDFQRIDGWSIAKRRHGKRCAARLPGAIYAALAGCYLRLVWRHCADLLRDHFQ